MSEREERPNYNILEYGSTQCFDRNAFFLDGFVYLIQFRNLIETGAHASKEFKE
jgi:hypothetical protein